jgi:hypothetical protein
VGCMTGALNAFDLRFARERIVHEGSSAPP